jgi:hypothetical protein
MQEATKRDHRFVDILDIECKRRGLDRIPARPGESVRR